MRWTRFSTMDVQERVFNIIRELSGVENISLESSLQGEIYLDSLSMVTLLIMVEDGFNIVLDESDMNPFDLLTVNDVIALVNKYVGDKDE